MENSQHPEREGGDELKGCPFCPGSGVRDSDSYGKFVRCEFTEHCGARSGYGDDCDELWNTRATPTQVVNEGTTTHLIEVKEVGAAIFKHLPHSIQFANGELFATVQYLMVKDGEHYLRTHSKPINEEDAKSRFGGYSVSQRRLPDFVFKLTPLPKARTTISPLQSNEAEEEAAFQECRAKLHCMIGDSRLTIEEHERKLWQAARYQACGSKVTCGEEVVLGLVEALRNSNVELRCALDREESIVGRDMLRMRMDSNSRAINAYEQQTQNAGQHE